MNSDTDWWMGRGGPEQDPRYNLTISLSLTNGKTYPHRTIVWPAHRGAVGYSSVKVAVREANVAFRFCWVRACLFGSDLTINVVPPGRWDRCSAL